VNPRNFFAELKRRNVYKVAVAYGVVGWLVMQVASTVVPALHLPDSITIAVVVLVLLGFPIALVIAWAFEMTPEGMKRTEDVSPDEKLPQWSRRKFAAFILIVVICAAALLGYQIFRAKPTPGSVSVSEKSIAVLPFDNLSEDKANAYFANGIQDEILTKLAAIDQLKVISRASTEKYRSHPEDIRKVAAELSVATILEGSVQKSGETAHINLQLIDAATDTHIWARVFDRELKNIFAVEGEVAEQVAAALKLKLLPGTSAKLAAPPTSNPEAYDLYLRAMYAHTQWFRGVAILTTQSA
jgi:TolB-like protein